MLKGTNKLEAADLAPIEIWSKIAALFSPIDLNHFMSGTKLFLNAAKDPRVERSICRELYQRLCRLDLTLPAQLPQENPIKAYRTALIQVQDSQKKEMRYLKKYYPQIVDQIMNGQQLDTLTPLAKEETLSTILDRINTAIITPAIDPQTNELNIENLHVTRIPSSLLTNPAYAAFFAGLSELNCNNNNIRILELRNLPALRILDCQQNGMQLLRLENLPALADVDCSDNAIEGNFDLKIFTHLYAFRCHNNAVSAVDVRGLLALESLDCSQNLLTELTVESPVLSQFKCGYNKISSLSLSHVDNLEIDEDFTVMGNKLKAIPPNLATKVGSAWAAEEILLQKPDLATEEQNPQTEDLQQVKEFVLGKRTREALNERVKKVAEDNPDFLTIIAPKIFEVEMRDLHQVEGSPTEPSSDEDDDASYEEEKNYSPNM